MKFASLLVLSLIPLLTQTGCKDKNGTVTPPSSSGTKLSSDSQLARESYQLRLNGCDTGRHDFQAASLEAVRQQLCQALQDSELNRFCAESLRRDFFEKKCAGQAWAPRVATVQPAASPVATQPAASAPPLPDYLDLERRDFQAERKMQELLKTQIVQQSTIAPGLTESEQKLAKKFSQDAIDCGISTYGPQCLDSIASRANPYLINLPGKTVFYNELKLQGVEAPLAMIVSIVSNSSTEMAVDTAEIYLIRQARHRQNLNEYIENGNSLRLLTRLEFAVDRKAALAKRSAAATNLRQLYHTIKLQEYNPFVDPAPNYANSQELARLFVAQSSLFTQSQDVLYQEATLRSILNRLPIHPSSQLEILEKLISSPSTSVRQWAAVFVLEAHRERSDLKPLVLSALSHSDDQIRIQAVKALAPVANSVAEQDAIIRAMDDSDSDVRTAASNASAKLSLTGSNERAVNALTTSDRYEVRQRAANLLQRLGTPSARTRLVEMMDDSDGDVRQEVVRLLRKMTANASITDAMVAPLSRLLNSDRWEVRRDAASMLATRSSPEITALLIAHLDDSDSDVRAHLLKLVSSRELSASSIDPLKAHFRSDHWTTRRDAATLLARNPDERVTLILIGAMDDSDSDVSQHLFGLIAKRKLTPKMVAPLAQRFESDQWQIRERAARLLGKIPTSESRKALEAQLGRESDSDVKKQIEASLKLFP